MQQDSNKLLNPLYSMFLLLPQKACVWDMDQLKLSFQYPLLVDDKPQKSKAANSRDIKHLGCY